LTLGGCSLKGGGHDNTIWPAPSASADAYYIDLRLGLFRQARDAADRYLGVCHRSFEQCVGILHILPEGCQLGVELMVELGDDVRMEVGDAIALAWIDRQVVQLGFSEHGSFVRHVGIDDEEQRIT
jgi:hypothetical protein